MLKTCTLYLRDGRDRVRFEPAMCRTDAEAMDVIQMAQSRQVSIHTLRAQIASIKAKMGLTRMTEIAVTIGRIEAAVTLM